MSLLEKERQRKLVVILDVINYYYSLSILIRDEDMQSLASLMSVNTIGDIAPLEDFEEEDCK